MWKEENNAGSLSCRQLWLDEPMDNLWYVSVQTESASYEMRCRKEANFLCENPCEKIFPKSAEMWKIC